MRGNALELCAAPPVPNGFTTFTDGFDGREVSFAHPSARGDVTRETEQGVLLIRKQGVLLIRANAPRVTREVPGHAARLLAPA